MRLAENQAKLDLAGPAPWSQLPSKTAAGTQNAPLVKGWGEGQNKLQLSRRDSILPSVRLGRPPDQSRARISEKEWEEAARALNALVELARARRCAKEQPRAKSCHKEQPRARSRPRATAVYAVWPPSNLPATALCAVPCGCSLRRYHRVWPLDLLYSLALSDT